MAFRWKRSVSKIRSVSGGDNPDRGRRPRPVWMNEDAVPMTVIGARTPPGDKCPGSQDEVH
jgi:hypothetical protein